MVKTPYQRRLKGRKKGEIKRQQWLCQSRRQYYAELAAKEEQPARDLSSRDLIETPQDTWRPVTYQFPLAETVEEYRMKSERRSLPKPRSRSKARRESKSVCDIFDFPKIAESAPEKQTWRPKQSMDIKKLRLEFWESKKDEPLPMPSKSFSAYKRREIYSLNVILFDELLAI